MFIMAIFPNDIKDPSFDETLDLLLSRKKILATAVLYPSDQKISNDEIYKQLTTISSINLKPPKEPIKIFRWIKFNIYKNY